MHSMMVYTVQWSSSSPIPPSSLLVLSLSTHYPRTIVPLYFGTVFNVVRVSKVRWECLRNGMEIVPVSEWSRQVVGSGAESGGVTSSGVSLWLDTKE